MPFKSEAQRRFLWANEPKVAKKWAHEGHRQKGLPAKVGTQSRQPKGKGGGQYRGYVPTPWLKEQSRG